MKHIQFIIISLLIPVFTVPAMSQEATDGLLIKVFYSYDANGNRISRETKEISLKEDSDDINKNPENTDVFTDHLHESEINIYPNPTQGRLRIDITNLEEADSRMKVYNLQGSCIYETEELTESNTVDLSGKPKGAYFLKILIGDKSSTWKIIKE